MEGTYRRITLMVSTHCFDSLSKRRAEGMQCLWKQASQVYEKYHIYSSYFLTYFLYVKNHLCCVTNTVSPTAVGAISAPNGELPIPDNEHLASFTPVTNSMQNFRHPKQMTTLKGSDNSTFLTTISVRKFLVNYLST